MAGGMLRTSEVEVNIAPVFVGFLRHESLVVARVHITQEVGTGACEAGHGVKFETASVLGLPVLGASQRGFACFGRKIFVDFGQQQRQLVIVEDIRDAFLVVKYGEWLAPVALTAEDGVAQAVIDLDVADAFFLYEFLCLGDSLLYGEAVEVEVGTA